MTENVVNLLWRIVVMGLIGVGCLVACALLYRGILDLLTAHYPQGISALTCGTLGALAVWWMCAHRNDLICAYPAR